MEPRATLDRWKQQNKAELATQPAGRQRLSASCRRTTHQTGSTRPRLTAAHAWQGRVGGGALRARVLDRLILVIGAETNKQIGEEASCSPI
jgi:hypothetical protein